LKRQEKHRRAASGERSFMQLVNQRTGDEGDTLRLEVMLLHEDLPAGRRGKEVLDQVALNLEPKASFFVNPWNFERLRNPALQGRQCKMRLTQTL
jgi:hypothetical protein